MAGSARFLAGHVATGHRSFDDGPEGDAGHTVEDPDESLLAHLRNNVDRFALLLDRQELRCGGIAVVPNVVVDHLEVPQPFARTGVESEERIGEQIGALAVNTVEVVLRAGCRSIDARIPLTTHDTQI